MGDLVLFSNNASTTLASPITDSATSIALSAGTGARFPNPSAGQVFYVTLEDASAHIEVCKVTARSTDALTVVRGQEGTTARAWLAGDRIECRVTAGILNNLVQHSSTTLSNPVTVSSDITFSGVPSFTSPVSFNSNADITSAGDLTVTGATSLSNTSIHDLVVTTGPNTVGGTTTFGGNVTFSSSVTFAVAPTFTDLSVNSISATNTSTFGNLTVNGTFDLNSAVTFDRNVTFGTVSLPIVNTFFNGSAIFSSNCSVSIQSNTTFSGTGITTGFTNTGGVTFGASTPVTFSGPITSSGTVTFSNPSNNPVNFTNLVATSSVSASGVGGNGTATTLARSDHTHPAGAQNTFSTIALLDGTGDIAGDNTIVADSATDILYLRAGANVLLSGDATSDIITVALSPAASGNAFGNIVVSGQSDVVADALSDTLTLVAGTGITLATNATTDTVTISSSGGTGGITAYGGLYYGGITTTTMPFSVSSTTAIPFTGDIDTVTGITNSYLGTAFGVTVDRSNFKFVITSNGTYKISFSGVYYRVGGSGGSVVVECRKNGSNFGPFATATGSTSGVFGRALTASAANTSPYNGFIVDTLATNDEVQLYARQSSGALTSTFIFTQLTFDIIKIA